MDPYGYRRYRPSRSHGVPLVALSIIMVSLLFVAAAMIVLAVAANASPPDAPCQRQGECRPDPQPDRGKDCEQHGKNPGGNQDHCAPGDIAPPDDEVGPGPSPDAPDVGDGDVPSDASPAPKRVGVERNEGGELAGLPSELAHTGLTENLLFGGIGLLMLGALIRISNAIILHAQVTANTNRKRKGSL